MTVGISIHAASWNISAVNNNPFEYWTSNPDPCYDALMRNIQTLIEDPDRDVQIHEIFCDLMFSDLCEEMKAQSIAGLTELKNYWLSDYRGRQAIRGFLKDKSIGTKRLASMPDRITNTINLQDGSVSLRPSVMNAYDGGSLASLDAWWLQWKEFMFRTHVQVFTGLSDVSPEPQIVCTLISPILRGKYPAITEEEQSISVPLQILCLAILDAIFIHILNSVAPGWEATRKTLCNALILGKVPRVCEIIAESYRDCDVVFIQEAAAVFVQDARQHGQLQARFRTLAPRVLDGKRDQNSLILVSRSRFSDAGGDVDVTQQVLDALGGAWVAPGDLLVVCVDEAGGPGRGGWLLASFHGDSNGLSSQPLVLALREIAERDFEDRVLLLGIDANTSSSAAGDAYHQSVDGFAAFLRDQQLVSLWGAAPDPAAWTTCSSRTYIQTQLNKAVPFPDRFARSQRSLKDWIVACERQIAAVAGAGRDNTGRRIFVDGTVLPTVEFPSDHAIVSAVFHVRPRPPPAADAAAPDATGSSVIAGGAMAPRRPRLPRPGLPRRPAARLADGRERTLYDYWGIGEKPMAFGPPRDLGASSVLRLLHDVQGDGAGGAASSEEEVARLVEGHYVHLVESRTWNDLDKQKREFSRSNDRSIWILFSTRPYTMAIRKLWFQMVVAVAGSAFLAQGALNVVALHTSYTLRAHALRLTAATLRNGSDAALVSPVLAGLGVMSGGCRQLEMPSTAAGEGSWLSVAFSAPLSIDGFWLVTSSLPPGGDPLRYRLDRATGSGDWLRIISPPWVLESRLWEVPMERTALKRVDLRAPVAWVLSSCVGIPSFSLACYLSCICGIVGNGRRGAVVISGGFMVLAVTQLIWSLYATVVQITNLVNPSWDSLNVNETTTWAAWLFFACCLFLSVVAYRERYTLDSFLVVFTLIGAGMVNDARDRATSSESGLYRAIVALIWSILPAIMLSLLILARYFTSRWVLMDFLAPDRTKYETAWVSVVTGDREQGALLRLTSLADSMQKKIDTSEARQYLSCQVTQQNPFIRNPFFRSSARRFSVQSALRELDVIPSTISATYFSKKTLITSLDQLMEQATCLNIFLKKKVKDLALNSGGAFQVKLQSGCGRSFELYTEAFQYQHDWLWAGVKPAERALEKLLRSYDCDVSRLLDCCRQRIVFDSISDLTSCLNMIRMDKEIEVVRIKNMLDEKFDSWRTGGFRAVILNLRIRSNETQHLGVDWHVCELQLNLRLFELCMSDESHSRFLVWRNCRDAPSLWRTLLTELRRVCDGFVRYCSSFSCLGIHASGSNRPTCQQQDIPTFPLTQVEISQEPSGNTVTVISDSGFIFSREAADGSKIVERGDRSNLSCNQSLTRGPADLAVHEPSKNSDFVRTRSNGNSSELCSDFANGIASKTHSVRIAEVSIRTELESMMQEQHRISMSSFSRYNSNRSGGAYGKGKMVEIAVHRAADGSVWDTSYPFAALLCKPWIPRLLGSVFALFLISLAAYLSLVWEQKLVQGYRFRFTTLRLRNGQEGKISGPGIQTLGFMKNGCGDEFNHLVSNKTVTTVGTFLVTFAEPISINGWYFVTTAQGPEEDPVRFILERSTQLAGDEWVITGSSSWLWAWSGAIFWRTGIHNTTLVRNATEYFDLGVPWVWTVHRVSSCVVLLIMTISILIAVATKHHMKAKWIAITFCSANGLMNGTACVVYALWGQWQAGSVAGGCFAIDMCLPATLILAERYLRFWIGAAGIVYPILVLIHYLALLQAPAGLVGDRGIGIIRNFGLLEGAGYFFLFLFALFTRQQSRTKALKIIKQDWDAYNRCWEALIQNDSFTATIEVMHDFTTGLSNSLSYTIVRQPQPAQGPGINDDSSVHANPVRTEDGNLLHHLQRLFAQAAGLDILLRAKVKEWALASDGCLRVAGAFESWERIQQRGAAAHVDWAPLKSLDRALEKVYRSYSLDSSRLLDCCRQSIYFEDVSSLFACLRAIYADNEVRLVRVCNRLHSSYEASATAGYRAVLLNMSIATENTVRLRLDGVICELQLALIDFARIKSDEGHARYVMWRNQRGQ